MRFSYDAFVLNNKKDAIYYSGPFSVTDTNLNLNAGEKYIVYGVNIAEGGTFSITGSDDIKIDSVSANAIQIEVKPSATAGTDYTLTASDGTSNETIALHYVG